MTEQNKEEHSLNDYFLLLFQTEFSNLVSNKELSSSIFYSLLGEAKFKDVKLANNQYMDLYLCENLFSTLLPALESLAKTSEKLIYYSHLEDQKEVNRFNPCNYLAEFLMRNNPKYGKNQETHQKFLKYTRKEWKTRKLKDNEKIMYQKVTDIYNESKVVLNKLNIESFVKTIDEKLNLNNCLVNWEWLEHFRVYKDTQTINLDEFLKAFKLAVLDLHEINEDTLTRLISEN